MSEVKVSINGLINGSALTAREGITILELAPEKSGVCNVKQT